MSINIIKHGYDISRNTSGGRAAVRYIVLHYTATHGATAENEVRYFGANPAAVNASADFFVDDVSIRQYNTQLDSRFSWAVGDGTAGTFGGVCCNANQVSIEMCCYQSGGRWYISDKTYTNAVELTKYLMAKYGVTADRVIRHYDVSRKLCPNAYGWLATTGSEAVWKRFKSDITVKTTTAQTPAAGSSQDIIYRVRRSADDAKSQIGAYRSLSSAKALADHRSGYSVFDTSGKLIYKPASAGKTNEELAREVIAGKWGNGEQRKTRLTAAGYDYAAVQQTVNRLLR